MFGKHSSKKHTAKEYTDVCQLDIEPEVNGMPLTVTMKQAPRDFAEIKSYIYDASHLHELLNAVDITKIPDHVAIDRYDELKAVRFVLNADGELVFAREGYPGINIPMHCEMDKENECITAGNMYFDASNQLVRISNQSGDFRPEFVTLQFAIRALAANNLLPEKKQLIIDELDDRGSFACRYATTREKILAHEFFKSAVSHKFDK